MSDYQTHIVGGFFGIAIAFLISVIMDYNNLLDFDYGMNGVRGFEYIYEILMMAFIGIYFSILPDADIGTSHAFKITFVAIVGTLLALMVFGNLSVVLGSLAIIMFVVMMLFGTTHRGMFHKWYFIAFLGFAVGYIFGSFSVGITAMLSGYSHLLYDDEI